MLCCKPRVSQPVMLTPPSHFTLLLRQAAHGNPLADRMTRVLHASAGTSRPLVSRRPLFRPPVGTLDILLGVVTTCLRHNAERAQYSRIPHKQ